MPSFQDDLLLGMKLALIGLLLTQQASVTSKMGDLPLVRGLATLHLCRQRHSPMPQLSDLLLVAEIKRHGLVNMMMVGPNVTRSE